MSWSSSSVQGAAGRSPTQPAVDALVEVFPTPSPSVRPQHSPPPPHQPHLVLGTQDGLPVDAVTTAPSQQPSNETTEEEMAMYTPCTSITSGDTGDAMYPIDGVPLDGVSLEQSRTLLNIFADSFAGSEHTLERHLSAHFDHGQLTPVHRRTSPARGGTGHGVEEDSERSGSDDLEARIQKLFLDAAKAEGQASGAPDIPLPAVIQAIEAHVDHVINSSRHHATASTPSKRSAPGVDDQPAQLLSQAILARHNEKNAALDNEFQPRIGGMVMRAPPNAHYIDVESDTSIAPAPNDGGRGVARPSNAAWRKFRLYWLFFTGVPIAIVSVMLTIALLSPVKVCDVVCMCGSVDAARYAFTFDLLQEFPRCLSFAALTEVLTTYSSFMSSLPAHQQLPVTQPRWDAPSLKLVFRKKRFWIMTLASTVLSIVLGLQPNTANVPEYVAEMFTALAVAVPMVIYCGYVDKAKTSFCLIACQLVPLYYQLLIPQYYRTPRGVEELLMAWPFVVILLERILFYFVHTVLPTYTPQAVRVMFSMSIASYSQALTASTILAVKNDDQTTALAVYIVLWVSLEALLRTTLPDKAMGHIYRAVSSLFTGRKNTDPSASSAERNSCDMRPICCSIRSATNLHFFVEIIIVMAFDHWPKKLTFTNCSGEFTTAFPWFQLVIIVCSMLGADLLGMLGRKLEHGTVMGESVWDAPPMSRCVESESWAVAFGLYLAMRNVAAISWSTKLLL